jgi:hypothetical protein
MAASIVLSIALSVAIHLIQILIYHHQMIITVEPDHNHMFHHTHLIIGGMIHLSIA